MTVRELLSKIGSDELAEWAAFYQIEPFGDYRADVRSGIIASTFANANRSSKTQPFKIEDFMPYLDKKKDKISDIEQLKSWLKSVGKKHG